uniref:Cyclin n=1 Tax=Paramoeba aestuarina TaxID=180227 RepID=A0A7S4P6V9_9EUKA|mmetsp:Transcript_37170/g.58530  ORF Transcript_37170/g.58530 Transcript_37170/m.58530 type:complete len:229 (+) Transcript_37170:152-838(+)
MNLQSYPNAPLEVLVREICSVLKREIQPTQTNQASTSFHCARKCSESTLVRTVQHITKYAPCTVECLGVSLIYLKRIKDSSPEGFVNHQTIEQLYVVGVMIASKYYDDLCYNNSVFSRILSIPKPDLRVLEIEYLRRIKFDCSFSREEFIHLSNKMLHGAFSEKTGYFSLTKRVFELLYPQSKSLTTSSRSQAQQKPRPRDVEKWRAENPPQNKVIPVPKAAPTTTVG